MTKFAGYSAIVPDVSKTVDFYVNAFGLELRYMHPTGQYAELQTGEALLSFTGEALWENAMVGDLPYQRARPLSTPGTGFIALIVDDIDGALEQAIRAGASKLTAILSPSPGAKR